jgi:hypothetical protein
MIQDAEEVYEGWIILHVAVAAVDGANHVRGSKGTSVDRTWDMENIEKRYLRQRIRADPRPQQWLVLLGH